VVHPTCQSTASYPGKAIISSPRRIVQCISSVTEKIAIREEAGVRGKHGKKTCNTT